MTYGGLFRRMAPKPPLHHQQRKVAILGAAGRIGQPLALLLKLNPLVSHIALYDLAGTPGIAADVSHVNTGAQVTGYVGEEHLGNALEGADVVIIPAGVFHKPGTSRDDLFNANAGIVKFLCTSIAKHCPEAIVNMISNPVNSMVPIAAEVFKKANTYNPKKLLGVTTLNVVLARTFYSAKKGVPVEEVDVPVVGGHEGITILPLFSQTWEQLYRDHQGQVPLCASYNRRKQYDLMKAATEVKLTDEEVESLTKQTQDGGTEVVQGKAGKGSAMLSMAYAAALFAESCLKGLNGEPGVVECSYVQSNIMELPFFSSKVCLGRGGVEEVLPLGPLSDYEKKALQAVMPELKAAIKKGIDFVHQS